MTDISIDIETLSAAPDAAVIQIGAVAFDPEKRDLGSIPSTALFDRTINLTDALRFGSASGSTLRWWFAQPKASLRLVDTAAYFSAPVFTELKEFLGQCGDTYRVWCHATFDAPILQRTATLHGVELWPYTFVRDLRTVVDIAYGGLYDHGRAQLYGRLQDEGYGKTHFGLDDALLQARVVQECLYRIWRTTNTERRVGDAEKLA